jgi:hypothetical protein
MLSMTSWRDVLSILRGEPTGTILRVPKLHLPHPSTFRMSESIGLPEGQRADYRKILRNGRGFHVKDFGTHYEAHIDAVHPDIDLLAHLRTDAPGAYVTGGVALGALLGAAFGKSKESALFGAIVGGMVSAMAAQNGIEKGKAT